VGRSFGPPVLALHREHQFTTLSTNDQLTSLSLSFHAAAVDDRLQGTILKQERKGENDRGSLRQDEVKQCL
jgi:hypothetical protein